MFWLSAAYCHKHLKACTSMMILIKIQRTAAYQYHHSRKNVRRKRRNVVDHPQI
jgi:hypothetical protein